MNRKKLAGIIAGCIIVAIVAIVILRHSLAVPPECITISAHDFAIQLFDPEYTDLQRDSFWQEYEGKQVRWISQLEGLSLEQTKAGARFLNPLDWGITEVVALFDESQISELQDLRKGDMIIYTGMLDSFGETEIALTDCLMICVPVIPQWWNDDINTYKKRIMVGDEVLCIGPSTCTDASACGSPAISAIGSETGEVLWEGEETEAVLMGIDSRYLYRGWLPRRSTLTGFNVHPDIDAVDMVSGEVAWSFSPPSFHISWVGCRSYIGLPTTAFRCLDTFALPILMSEIADRAEPNLLLLALKLPLADMAYEYGGLNYTSFGEEHAALQAIDPDGRVLWTAQFEGMMDFSIENGILYVLTDQGIGAFELPTVAELQNPNS